MQIWRKGDQLGGFEVIQGRDGGCWMMDHGGWKLESSTGDAAKPMDLEL